jgi:predicted nucleic-acid-binding protein
VIAIDTSILVRYVVQDDPIQSARATRLFENELTQNDPGLVTAVALHELAWVLKKVYKFSTDEVGLILTEILEAPNLVVEHDSEVLTALSANVAFSDALIHHIGSALGASKTVTFDRKFARLDGVDLLQS